MEVDEALDRIRRGVSKENVEDIRGTLDKERANKLKCNLPSVCFSGIFGEDRTDESLEEHSGFIVLDFDGVDDVEEEKYSLTKNKFVYACWVSPSGNGLKALVKISDGSKHRQHFEALQDNFEDLDNSGVNVARVCYESYDEDIYINKSSEVFKEIVEVEEYTEDVDDEVFKKILRWLSNKGDAFQQGERNTFIFKLAAACSRFGIEQDDCYEYCSSYFNDNSFSDSELKRTIRSAYKASIESFDTAEFTHNRLVYKETSKEVDDINPDLYDIDIKPKDVIFGEDVKEYALDIYDKGYESVDGIDVKELDALYKMKRGEVTLLTGIGNYGKSAFLKWYMLMRILVFEDKFALFAPEDNPAQEFYHDMVEIYLGCDCTPKNVNRPTKKEYEQVYDFISKHMFYVYPKDVAPTPEYIKERFLELIIKENVSGCIIDPFNQMQNNYNSAGGRSDKYLETLLSDFSRFSQLNNIYFLIVAHPKLMKKDADGSYPCPDVFDIADGAMWNNKLDCILVYHRPNHQTNPNGSACEFHSKKIRRQKTVGMKGFTEFDLNRKTRRFVFNGVDHIEKLLHPSSDSEKELPKLTPSTDIF